VERETSHELEATLAARRELGPAHDAELVAGFLDRIEKEIDKRVDERVAERARRGSALNPATLAVCIPIIAIAGGIGHVAGLITAFIALIVVFGFAELRR
jgi:CHASE3 domain sensor protein